MITRHSRRLDEADLPAQSVQGYARRQFTVRAALARHEGDHKDRPYKRRDA
jgi:hypothetical protein